MREKKPYGRRSQEQKRYFRKKFLLVCEGLETEVQYFEGISRHRTELAIHSLVDVQIVERLYSEEKHSHPKSLLKDLQKTLDADKEGTITLESVADRIIALCRETWERENADLKEIRHWNEIFLKRLHDFCECEGINPKDSFDHTTLKNFLDNIIEIASSSFGTYFLKECLSDLIEEKSILYDKEIDTIALIVDRDAHSWKKENFNAFHLECRRLGYELVVTNPCIEFWFLLHFSKADHIDMEKMLANKKLSSSKSAMTYAESELRKVLKTQYGTSYNKSKIPLELLVNHIDTAITNVSFWSEDIQNLENHLGSGIGLLIKAMRKKP